MLMQLVDRPHRKYLVSGFSAGHFRVLNTVHVRANLCCSSNVEVPYYSCGSFLPVCIYCGSDKDLIENEDALIYYPMCEHCRGDSQKTRVLKRK